MTTPFWGLRVHGTRYNWRACGPTLTKQAARGLYWALMGMYRKGDSVDFTLMNSTPSLFYFHYCNEVWGMRISLWSSAALEVSAQLVAAPFHPMLHPTGQAKACRPPHGAAGSAHLWLRKKHLTQWLSSSISCEVLGKTRVCLGKILQHFTYGSFCLYKVEKPEFCSMSITTGFSPTCSSPGSFLSSVGFNQPEINEWP